MKIVTTVLCAGKSSRFKTKFSKMLYPLGGRPMVFWPIKNALSISPKDTFLVVNHQREDIEKSINNIFQEQELSFIVQEELNGTGGAIKSLLPHLNKDASDLLVTFGDAPLIKTSSLKNLIESHIKSSSLLSIMTSNVKNPIGYGRIIRDENSLIEKIVEENEASEDEKKVLEVNTGIWLINIDFLKKNIDKLKEHNQKKEYYITDLVSIYQSQKNLPPINSFKLLEEEMQGVNDLKQAAKAQKIINQRIIDFWLSEGISFIDENNTYIEENVRLSPNVIIYPQVHIKGECHIGEGVIIENGSIIADSIIEKNSHILPYTICEKSIIQEESVIGPFARIRPKSHIESRVKVGNFVEVKASRLKKGTKANHLSYIGDATLGENVNMGAGSITCNFDGKDKHQTIIGDDAFIGSNVNLIAPIEVGEKAFIAAGSTINKDVPKNALAFGRAKVEIKERS